VKTEQTEGRQPMTWSTVKWAVMKTAVRRIQERIFRAAKMTKRRRLEPYAGGLCAVKAANRIPAAGRRSWERCFWAVDLTGWRKP
jgi:hypothetical protein